MKLEDVEKILKDHESRLKELEGKLTNKSRSKGQFNETPSSVFDYILELKDEGFFDKPKVLKDIVSELARRGYHYRSTSLTNPLQRAVRQKKIGREGVKGKWQYVKG